MFGPASLAILIIDDGYATRNTIILCTENFSKQECLLLVNLLSRFGMNSFIKIRNKLKDRNRIHISSLSMPIVQDLVKEHFYPSFIYKLKSRGQVLKN